MRKARAIGARAGLRWSGDTWRARLFDRPVLLGSDQPAHRSDTAAIWFRARVSRSKSFRRFARRVGPDFPLVLRWSQWKLQDFEAKLATNSRGVGSIPAAAGRRGRRRVSLLQRRFWEPEFPDSDLNLAGWTKKLTGKPSITVGSVTLNEDLMTSFGTTSTAVVTGIDNLLERLERDEFDLVAIGRSLIVNPAWPGIMRRGALSELLPFNRAVLSELV